MNTNLVRSLYAAFAEGDVGTVLALLASDIRWIEAEGFPYGGTYVGPDAVLSGVFARLGSEWDGFSAVPHTFVAEGETVVALGDYGGTYKASGKSFAAPFAHAWTFGSGKVVRFQQYTDTAIVRAALS